MKSLLGWMSVILSLIVVGGCCTDMSCGTASTQYVVANKCSCVSSSCTRCSSCSTCGYDASYTYSGWY